MTTWRDRAAGSARIAMSEYYDPKAPPADKKKTRPSDLRR
jgi:hypothetical protein